MRIDSNYVGRFIPAEYSLSSSLNVDYIPLISCFGATIIDSIETLYLYEKPNYNTSYQIKNTTQNLLDILEVKLNLYSSIISTVGNTPLILVFGKGYIGTPEGNILMTLAVAKDKMIRFRSGLSINEEEDVIMYLATELVNDPKYATFYRRIHKAYLSHAYTKGIEVRIMTSAKIEKNTFVNEFKLQYNTIDQLQSHLQNEVGRILALTDDDFITYNPGLNIPPPSEEELLSFSVDERKKRASIERSMAINQAGIVEQLDRVINTYTTVSSQSIGVNSILNSQYTVGTDGNVTAPINSISASEYIIQDTERGVILVPNPEYHPDALEEDEDNSLFFEDDDFDYDEELQEEIQEELEERLEEESADEPWTIVEAGVEDHNGDIHAIDSEIGTSLMETLEQSSWGRDDILFIDDEETLTSEEDTEG